MDHYRQLSIEITNHKLKFGIDTSLKIPVTVIVVILAFETTVFFFSSKGSRGPALSN